MAIFPENVFKLHLIKKKKSMKNDCNWRNCGTTYVGETYQHLHTGVSDHMEISSLTGKRQLKLSLNSFLSDHRDSGYPVPLEDFKILSSSSFESELFLRESLLINNYG